MLEKDIDHILFSEEQLKARVREIAGQIDRDFAGKEPMLISVLRGSFIFMADLMRSITLPCTVDFMAVSSYGAGTIHPPVFNADRFSCRHSHTNLSIFVILFNRLPL